MLRKASYPLAVTWSSWVLISALLPILPVLGETVRKTQFPIVFCFAYLPEKGDAQADVSVKRGTFPGRRASCPKAKALTASADVPDNKHS